MGTGVLALADGISPDSLTEGGTGSHSFDPQMPPDLPDRLEAGTLNNPGILSLGAGVRFIEKTGRAEIHEYEMRLTRWLYEELAACPGIKLYTPPGAYWRAGAQL
ncbi:MAG: aminotransferase class V-fold PLP-dependent enzyme [Acutalibacteraceae bacterium]